MDDLSFIDSSKNSQSNRLESIRSLIMNHKGDLSVDLLLDIFQNLILDCKSIAQCNSNKYLNTLFQMYETINDQLYTLRVKPNDFNVLKVIGQGAFGQVQLVRHKDTGHLYAMKILNKAQMKCQEGSVFWKEERDIMTQIDSRWIVKLHYAFQDPRRLYMAMEYLPGGNLVNWMGRLDDVFEADVCFYTAEIVLAVSTLHQYNFVHRDIKPDNMLLDIRGHIKLADFGSCVRVDPKTKHVTCNRAVGTPDYISPEVLLSQSNNSKYGCEVDWWALGVMLYEIFYGDPPFYSDTLINTYGKIMTHTQSLNFPPDEQVSETAISIMKGLICDRSVRLGAGEAVNDIKLHKFFTSPNYKWNWDNIHDFDAPFVPQLQNDWDTSHFDFTEDDENDGFNNDNATELGSKVFGGENLQFSGFSFSDIFKDFTQDQIKVSSTFADNKGGLSVTDTVTENEHLISKIHNLNKENQEIKNSLEKLSIERKDLETQLQTVISKCKNEEGISNKLQIDYSDLMSKHELCQQKISKLEEEKHKLCADFANVQSSSNDESRRLLAQIENQHEEFRSLHVQLSESQADYRKSKLQCVKFENDLKYIQKKYESLEHELSKLRQTDNPINAPQSENVSQERISLELKELRLDYEEKSKDLDQQLLENQSLCKLVTSLQKEKELLRISLVKAEDQLARENDSVKRLNVLIKENNDIIENLKSNETRVLKKIELSSKIEKELKLKLSRLNQVKLDDKQRHENEIEEQRTKLNTIITSKYSEIQQMKKTIDTLNDENSSLKNEIQMEKAQCSVLVDKINEIITGKSISARQMMLSEDMKSGKLGQKTGRYYNQVLKQNKKLQSLYDQLEKDSIKKEKDFKTHIETLEKEKDTLENENNSLKSNIAHYENIVMSESVDKRASVVTHSSQGSFDSGYTIDPVKITSTPLRNSRPLTKPPMLNLSSISSSPIPRDVLLLKSGKIAESHHEKTIDKLDVTIRQNKTKVYDKRRFSITESISPDFIVPAGQLDVNVKAKGKKMSWEKRFVKIDSQNLIFYDQSLENVFLKLPLSSLVLVRKVHNYDVIHAKKGEIPRIFQIFYDKNRNIYSEVIERRSVSGSTSSINTLGSGKSNSKDSVINEFNEAGNIDCTSKQGSRRSSLARYLPRFGSKNKVKGNREELSINSINTDAVFLRGHVFMPSSQDLKSNCDICKKPLTSTPSIALMSNQKDLRTVIDTSVRLFHNSRDIDPLSSTVDTARVYKCYHCSISVHGFDLDEKMNICPESVAIQLCRASSEELLADWIKCLNDVIKSLQMSMSSPAPSRSNIGSRSATLR